MAPETPSIDWSTIAEAVECPLCQYNLRGLTEPRCPECGHRFTWPEVLDPTLRRHRYLYEHHSERDVSSFFRTLFASWRPGRFWKELHPGQPSSVGRLWKYLIVLWIFVALPLIALTVLGIPHESGFGMYIQSGGLITYVPSPMKLVSIWHLPDTSYAEATLILTAALLVLPLVTFCYLVAIFWISMHHARVRPAHVFRCVVYSYGFVTPTWLVVLGAVLLNATGPWAGQFNEGLLFLMAYGALAVWLVHAWQLYIAYKRYMRFNAPFATIFALELIVGLSFLVIFLRIAGF